MASGDAVDPLEALRRLWAPLSAPPPGMAMPTLDPDEVAKRIADLRAVEGWLQMNLDMVKLAIGGLEAQHATLLALRSPSAAGVAAHGIGKPPQATAAALQSMAWPWGILLKAMADSASDPVAGERGVPSATAPKKRSD